MFSMISVDNVYIDTYNKNIPLYTRVHIAIWIFCAMLLHVSE